MFRSEAIRDRVYTRAAALMGHALSFALLIVLAIHARPALAQNEHEPATPYGEKTNDAPTETQPTGSTPHDVTPPKPLETPVVYPEGQKGDAVVVLELTIGADGRVVTARTIAGPEPFASAAREQASTWRFTPAARDGRAVAARIRYQVKYVQEVSEAPEEAEPSAPPAVAAEPEAAPGPGEPEYRILVRGERAGSVVVTRAEANLLPGTFGDPFRAIELLPGVSPIVSGLPFFYIRGAPPGNVGYFIDGIRVPLLFHGFIGPAVIHPAMIESVELYRGGYPARYGRFAGGIVEAGTLQSADRFRGEASVRVIDAGAMVAAPLAEDRAHVTAAGHYSYTGLILSLISNAVLEYWDYQVLADYELSKSDTLGVFGFGAYDFAGDDDREDFAGTEFHRLDFRYDHAFDEDTSMRAALTLGLDRSLATNGTILDRSIGGRTEWKHHASGVATWRFGADVIFDRVELDLEETGTNLDDFRTLFSSRDELVFGGYTEVELRPENWVTFTPGLRADVYESAGERAVGVDPRVAATFDVSERLRLLHAFGIAHQTPNFVPSLPGARVGGLRGGLQRSVQSSAGVEADGPLDVTGSLTFFQQAFFNLSDPLGFSRAISADLDTADIRATGYAYGMEVLLRRPLTRRLGGLLSYTLSRSVRSHDRLESLSAFDRTHAATLALGYDFGGRWRAGARASFVSGVPVRELTVDGPRFTSERAPPFFRLDLRVEKRWRFSERAWWGIVAEILNATAGREVVGRSCNPIRCTDSVVGPIVLPSVGVEAGF